MKTSPRTRCRHWLAVLGVEALHAVLWLPVLLIVSVSFLLAHLSVPALAEAERWAVRRLGVGAPSGREEGAPVASWYAARVVTAAFWRQDLPLAVASLSLGLVSVLVTITGAIMLVIAVGLPWIASEETPVNFGAWEATRPGDAWWAGPIGLLLAVVCMAILVGIGRLRLALTEVLSRDLVAERVRELDDQVGDLTRGRATLVDAFEAERCRIERDLHDGVQQHLSALAMTLGSAQLAVARVEERERRDAIRTRLDRAQEQTEAALVSLRATVRAVRPAVLTDRGLAAAVRELCTGSGLEVWVSTSGDDAALAPPVATAVYFGVSEALTNAARHSGACTARVTLVCSVAGVEARVEDGGVGGAGIKEAGSGSTGLAGIAQRMAAVGGQLMIDSAPGQGTRISLSAPAVPPW
ncbi:sensor histidine kinase [Actinomyces trachealis]|uniref:sensor histidine kinase n=1 Tax=Actinomyces trachealis TaxID=2763540 RepID=UPI001892B31A|nr:sensor histidine kinase [Actinomyces trachealis]